jgi:hypothetical protein
MVTFHYENGIELLIFQVLPEEMGQFGLKSIGVEKSAMI